MQSYIFLIVVLLLVGLILVVTTFTHFKLTNDQYDRLKWLVVRWSVITAFLGVIIKTFSIPYGLETVTIVAAIGVLLAGLMGISNDHYDEGGTVCTDEEWVEDGDIDG